MNKTVQRIVEILFQDAAESEEVQATRDEVMANCQEHFEDLMARGLTEDEAIAEVIESLRGMEDVVKQYPKQAEGYTAFSGADRPVTRIEAEVNCWDVEIRPSAQNRIDVQVDGQHADLIGIDFDNDGTLRISCREQTDTQQQPTPDPDSMRWDSFSDFMRNIGTLASSVMKRSATMLGGGTIHIEAPQSLVEVKHRASSGNLEVQGLSLERLVSTSTSGDLRAECAGDMKEIVLESTSGNVEVTGGGTAQYLKASSTSGDVDLHLNVRRAEVTSMSGDLELTGSCGQLSLSTISGDADVFCTNARFGVLNAKTVSGDLTIDAGKAGIDAIDAKTTSGDLEIVLPDEESSVHAAVKTVSGDVSNRFADAGPGAVVNIHAQTVSGDVTIR